MTNAVVGAHQPPTLSTQATSEKYKTCIIDDIMNTPILTLYDAAWQVGSDATNIAFCDIIWSDPASGKVEATDLLHTNHKPAHQGRITTLYELGWASNPTSNSGTVEDNGNADRDSVDRYHCHVSLILLLLLLVEIDDGALLVTVEIGWALSPSSHLLTTIDMGN